LKTFLEHRYDDHFIHIADDGNGERYTLNQAETPDHYIWKSGATSPHEMESALEVFNDLKKEFRNGLALSYGPRMGIWGNKNRGIYHFLERCKEATHLCLMDDDLRMKAPGFMEELADVLDKNTFEHPINGKTSLSHINTTWSDSSGDFYDPLKQQSWKISRDGWFETFPLEAVSYRCEWRKGSMGCATLFTRKTIEDIGYMSNLGGSLYGYEHSLYSGKSLLKTDRRSPQLLPSYDATELYMEGGAIPNAYSGTVEEAAKGDPHYQRRMNDYAFGLGLKETSPGFDPKKETILS
jgi:hypothetical protein